MIGELVTAATLLAGATPFAQLEKCTLTSADRSARVRALCGSIQAPADHTREKDDQGRTRVAVGYGVLEAKARPALADPVVFLAGGPGQASTQLAPVLGPAFELLRDERHIVFFDARGTGRSTGFFCKDERPLAAQLASTIAEDAAQREKCLRDAKLDPKSVTTEQIARDLELVRLDLGVEQLNLVGGSYGTRLALVYDRLFPGRVRSMVLDGVVPAEMIVGDGASADALRSLEVLEKRAPPPKGSVTPPLVEIVRTLARTPPTIVTLAHPVTGAPATIEVEGKTLVAVVRLLLYSEEGAAVLPPLLRLAHEGDLRPMAAQLFALEKTGDEIDTAMQLSVICAEDAPFFPNLAALGDPGDVKDGSDVFPDARREFTKACAEWPHATVDAKFHTAVTSQTPTLLLSGEGDPVTPPGRAELAAQALPNSVSVVITGVGHGTFFRGCMPKMLSAFVDEPDPKALDRSCPARMRPFPAFADGMGPPP